VPFNGIIAVIGYWGRAANCANARVSQRRGYKLLTDNG